jgi:RimJ/RimL family protein N-acetyltransferase
MITGKFTKLIKEYREDVKFTLKYLKDPEIKKYPFIPFPLTYNNGSELDEKTVFNDNYNFAIETLADKKYIGNCGLRNLDKNNRSADIGIFIGNKEYVFKGYGVDAMMTLIGFIFSKMDLNKIKLDVYEFNKKAIKFYQQCGFRKEGVLKDEIFMNGIYYDVIRMAIFRNDFENKKGEYYGQ